MKDALDLLKRFVDGRFVGQQGICDVEVALFFRTNRRSSIQGALITSVIGKAGAGFQARDVSRTSVSVFFHKEKTGNC